MQTPVKARRRSQAGLTLIELLVTMIIMGIVTTMLVGGWISLQRSYAFARSKNTSRATARDALDRISSELRASQPPTSLSATQFYLTGTAPYVCGPTSIVFYSAYNNSAAADGSGLAATGTTPPTTSPIRLTAIWLDTSGTSPQKTLYWQRDTNNNGTFDNADKMVVLARNVVNTAAIVNKDIFKYYFRDADPKSATYGKWSDSSTLASSGANSPGNLRSIQVEIVVDANISHTPTYVDIRTTIRPRNASAIF